MGSSHYVVAIDISVRMNIQASRSVPAESPLPWKPLDMLYVSYSTVMMPKYGKSREHLKRNKKHLTQAWAGGRRAACVREVLWDVLEYVLPLLPARALLRAGVVWASLETRLGSFTQVWVV